MKNILIIAVAILVLGVALVTTSLMFYTSERSAENQAVQLKKAERPIRKLPDRKGEPEILLGCSISMSGRFLNEGHRLIEGYNFIIERINAAGGIAVGENRLPVRIIYYDDESRVEKVRDNIRKLIIEDKVDFLLGPFSSTLTLAATEISEKHGVIMVEPAGASEVIFSRGARSTFGAMTTASWYLRDFFKMVSRSNESARTYAVVAMDKLFPRNIAKGTRIWGDKFGLKEVYSVIIDLNRENWLVYLEELKAKSPDIVIFAGHYLDSVNFVRQMKSVEGLRPKAVVLTLGPTQRKFVQELGADAEYMTGISQWSRHAEYKGLFFKSPDDYASQFKMRFGLNPTYQNAQASIACLIYQMAIEKAGSLDAQKVLYNLRNMDTDTFYGKIRFDDRGINIGHEMVIVQIQNGKQQLIWSAGPTKNWFVYPIPQKEKQ